MHSPLAAVQVPMPQALQDQPMQQAAAAGACNKQHTLQTMLHTMQPACGTQLLVQTLARALLPTAAPGLMRV